METEREYAEYPELTVEFMPNSHRYALIRDELRLSVPSVTSVLKVLDKSALVPWAEKCGVEGALRLEREGWLRDVSIEDATGVMRGQKMGAEARREAGADRGTSIHEALRIYCFEGTVPNIKDFAVDVQGYVRALCSWLLDAKPTPIFTETMVGSWKHRFAGRLDLFAEIDGQHTLVDLKTSPTGRVYDEAHLQAAAYGAAMVECGLPQPERAIIVGLGGDGTPSPELCLGELGDFLATLATHRAVSDLRKRRKAAEREALKEAA